MNKHIKNALIGAGITAGTIITAGMVSSLITKKLVSVALDREEPEIMNTSRMHLSGKPVMKEFLEMREQAAQKLENAGCETVEITAHDDERLVGHWHSCENAKRIIIAMHGWRSSWVKDFGLISDFLFQNDCHVLFAEQRGQNNSGGNYMGFGLLERHDCLDWIRWVNQQGYDNMPIYLCGVSMGSSTVLMAAGFDLPENVHGIIADCGYTSPNAIWKHVMENNLRLYYDDIQGEIAAEICRRKIQIGPKDYSCTSAMAKCRVPVLFIHGTDDDFVPIEMTYENYKACIAPKRLLVVPGAGHGMSYVVNRESYEQMVTQFWKDFD
mgnify:CR=1 FL=1